MGRHRLTWRGRIPGAFAEARSLKGDRLRPKDVVDVLARELPTLERRQITDNVVKYLRKGADGIYGISESRGLAVRPSSSPLPPMLAGTTASPTARPLGPADGQSSPRNPTSVPPEIAKEIQRIRGTSVWRRMVEEGDWEESLGGEEKMTTNGRTPVEEVEAKLKTIEESLKTCHGEDCRRLDELKAKLTAVETSLPEKVKAAMDSRTALLDERLKDIEAAVSTSKVPPAAPAQVEVTIPEDRVFVCPKCGDALVIGQAECPNETCEEVIDWALIFTPEFLRSIEKELEHGENDTGPVSPSDAPDHAH